MDSGRFVFATAFSSVRALCKIVLHIKKSKKKAFSRRGVKNHSATRASPAAMVYIAVDTLSTWRSCSACDLRKRELSVAKKVVANFCANLLAVLAVSTVTRCCIESRFVSSSHLRKSSVRSSKIQTFSQNSLLSKNFDVPSKRAAPDVSTTNQKFGSCRLCDGKRGKRSKSEQRKMDISRELDSKKKLI